MLKKLLKILGLIWALPTTMVGLLYVLAYWSFDLCTYDGIHGDALVWSIDDDRLPSWLALRWRTSSGWTLGNIVVLHADITTDRGRMVLLHEQEHVRQCSVLGMFYPFAYVFMWVMIRLVCPRSDAFYSHPFEVEARRAAHQVIDVEGTVRRIQQRAKHGR